MNKIIALLDQHGQPHYVDEISSIIEVDSLDAKTGQATLSIHTVNQLRFKAVLLHDAIAGRRQARVISVVEHITPETIDITT